MKERKRVGSWEYCLVLKMVGWMGKNSEDLKEMKKVLKKVERKEKLMAMKKEQKMVDQKERLLVDLWEKRKAVRKEDCWERRKVVRKVGH